VAVRGAGPTPWAVIPSSDEAHRISFLELVDDECAAITYLATKRYCKIVSIIETQDLNAM
jgi:hypothetical protein